MSTKRAGGLTHNPLLARTAPDMPQGSQDRGDDTSPHVDTSTRPQGRTSTSPSKFTFYFTPEQLERLDEAWDTMRRYTKGRRQRVSKSQFVRLALDRLLDDFERDPTHVTDVLLQQTERG